jgi:lipopolysaccharide transport system ATP-binding protein
MNAIEVDKLSKKYVISHRSNTKPRTIRDLLDWRSYGKKDSVSLDGLPSDQENFWALKDVSFSVGEGERVAIIGGNGAGKSTLLKILSRITEPTSGKVAIRGKVSSLLEVGTGFHPELTGRENIYLNGAVLGMKRIEIAAKFDQIVAFSGVEKFIDTPVKHYSSGMYVRLAFSVSAWLDPDILIVDEVLSVGDQAFQRRCAERMKELTGAGRTVLFVSHSMAAVKAMCEKALFLEKGRLVSYESVDDAATLYLRSIEPDESVSWHKATFNPQTDIVNCHGLDTRYVECLSAEVLNDSEMVTPVIEIHKSSKIKLVYEVKQTLTQDAVPHVHFYDEFGARVFVSYPSASSPIAPGRYAVLCHLPAYLINTGRYSITLIMSSFYGGLEYLHHFAYEAALRFEVVEKDGIDERRHGWAGPVPGVTRPRLNWDYSGN